MTSLPPPRGRGLEGPTSLILFRGRLDHDPIAHARSGSDLFELRPKHRAITFPFISPSPREPSVDFTVHLLIGMERLPGDLCLKIFLLLDHRSLAAAPQVCRKWRVLAANDALWSNLFKERWGGDSATFYAPNESKSWKDVYIVQDRCDRFGLGLKIIREGSDYFLIHQGEIQRYLGSGKPLTRIEDGATPLPGNEEHQSLIADGFLFFLGDLETACAAAKRVKM